MKLTKTDLFIWLLAIVILLVPTINTYKDELGLIKTKKEFKESEATIDIESSNTRKKSKLKEAKKSSEKNLIGIHNYNNIQIG